MTRKKTIRNLAIICMLLLSFFVAISNGGMVPVKAQEEEIGRNQATAYGGTFGEIVTMELVAYDDSRDVGTYRFRYYLYHYGESYTYQAAAVGVFLDGNHKATFGDYLGSSYKFSNDTLLFGSADVEVSAGSTHHFRLQDIGGGGLTEVSMDKDVYIPYPSYDVVYKDWNGTTLKSQSVTKYQNASAPANPSRTGYTFAGWSNDGIDIRGNRTITANYYINYYTVRYLDYNNTVLKTQSVPYTSNATPPNNPNRTGYTFVGWNNNGTNITGARDITAQYSINNYTISFNSMGGSAISSQTVQYQSRVAKPSDPTRANFKFMGWYTDALFRTPYNFNSAIGANNFTLYAKWDAFPTISASNITIHDKQYTFDDWQKLKLKGVSSYDAEDGSMTSKIKITKDTVNLDVPGTYAINYQVTDSVGTTVNKEMKVNVLFNNPPKIEYKNYDFYEDEITLDDWKDDYLMNAIKATDVEDGNMTSKVVVESDNVDPSTPGDYLVVYSVKDQYNKTTKVTANIKIKYNFAPLITAEDRKYMQNEFSQDDWEDHIMDDVEAIDVEDGNITKNIKVIEDDVDMETVGFYRVKYKVVDAYGKKHIKSIQVEIVLNVPPIIKAENKSFFEDELTAEGWQTEIIKDVTAFDTEDGDVTSKIEIIKDNVNLSKAGAYEVTYSIVDSGGKETEKTIDVTIKNNHEPKLEILANNKRFVEGQYTVDQWLDTIRMENVTAKDIEDNDITEEIKIEKDNVNTNKAGTYEVTYEVTDKYGKTSSKTIKVTVEENLAPVIYATDKWFDVADNVDDKAILKDVIAFDEIDGDITKNIIIKENTIDASKSGDYSVTYSVKDGLSKETARTIIVHISDKGNKPTPPPVDPPVSPSDKNAVVFANGKNYGTIQLSKIMESSDLMDNPYDSVIFGIYVADDIIYKDTPVLKKDNLIGIIKLDENHDGFGNVYHEGYYYVQEIAVNDQYELIGEKFYFKFEY